MPKSGTVPVLTPEEAASMVFDGATIAFGGFANSGAPKLVPRALAHRVRQLHAVGVPFKIKVITGGATNSTVDEPLAGAKAISWRAPYQNSPSLRRQINEQRVQYLDLHLSGVSRILLSGFFGKVDFAIIEATDVTSDGRVTLSSSIGIVPTLLQCAERVIIEVNDKHSKRLGELSDIVVLPPPPKRGPVAIFHPLTRVGYPYAQVDPAKIVGIVKSSEGEEVSPLRPRNDTSTRIANHIARFLGHEMRHGLIPGEFLPLQVGVGNLCNGVLAALGGHPEIPPFRMYTLAVQDAMVELMEEEKLLAASATSLSMTSGVLSRFYENLDYFASRVILRPQEISNDAGVVRRLGVIAINPAIEVDIYGNVNSSHIYGTDMVNGVGGSAEFTRNSFLSFMMCPSVTKGGRVSTVVPMSPHIDNNEHSVQVVVTEQGLADLRGLGPMQRARVIIENCAHPAYRDYLHRYIERSRMGHIRHDLESCYEMHLNLMDYGAMIPDMDFSQF